MKSVQTLNSEVRATRNRLSKSEKKAVKIGRKNRLSARGRVWTTL